MNVQSRLELIVVEVHWVMGEPFVSRPWLFSTSRLASFCNLKMPTKLFVLAGLTVKLIVVVFVRLPLMPVTVTVAVPVVALVAADSVRVLVVVVLVGLNKAVTPEGNPEAERLTLPVKPLMGLTVIVLVPLVPWTIVKLLGEADSEKLGAGEVMLTLSKLAVLRLVLLCAVTASPAVKLVAIVTLVLANWVQVVPLVE